MTTAELGEGNRFDKIRTDIRLLKTVAKIGKTLVQAETDYEEAVDAFGGSFVEAPAGYRLMVVDVNKEDGGMKKLSVHAYPAFFTGAPDTFKENRDHFMADSLGLDTTGRRVLWISHATAECVELDPDHIWHLQRDQDNPDDGSGDREPRQPLPSAGPTSVF